MNTKRVEIGQQALQGAAIPAIGIGVLRCMQRADVVAWVILAAGVVLLSVSYLMFRSRYANDAALHAAGSKPSLLRKNPFLAWFIPNLVGIAIFAGAMYLLR